MNSYKSGIGEGEGKRELTFRNITIRIADTVIPLRIGRSEREEAAMRRAATKVNRLYSDYQRLYPEKEAYEHMMFVALHTAAEIEQQKTEEEEIQMEQRLSSLVDRLDDLD